MIKLKKFVNDIYDQPSENIIKKPKLMLMSPVFVSNQEKLKLQRPKLWNYHRALKFDWILKLVARMHNIPVLDTFKWTQMKSRSGNKNNYQIVRHHCTTSDLRGVHFDWKNNVKFQGRTIIWQLINQSMHLLDVNG